MRSEAGLRICLVSRELAPYGGGGIGTYVAGMARALAECGHEVHVLTQPHPGLPTRSAEGVRLHSVRVDEGLAASERFSYFPQRWAVAVHEALSRLHAAHPFQAIEFPEFFGEGAYALKAHRRLGAFPGAVLAVRLHTPSVLVRELDGVQRLEGEASAIDVMERDALRDADLVLSPTRSLLELASERFGPLRRGEVVPHPFSPEWAADLGNVDRVPASSSRILYFGRLERRKGVQLLLPALEKVCASGIEAELLLVGGDTPTGPAETSMRAWLERAVPPSVRSLVRYEPARSRAALGAAIATASVCCFPSLWENFPNVCLEAMALGCPVVGSDAGGMAELIEDGKSGLLFRSGEVTALAEALIRVLGDKDRAAALGEAGRVRLKTYCDPRAVVASFVEALRQAQSHPPPRVVPSGRAPSHSPCISVVVPFFNLASTLPDTLASLDAQSFKDFETIIVDDGSTEGDSRELLRKLERDPRIRLVRQPNGGLSSARNAGLAVAEGRYVLPLDADDAIAPAFLARTLEVLESDLALGWCATWVEFFVKRVGDTQRGWIPLGHAPELMLADNVAGSCTALFRRDLLEEVGGYDESFPSYEDWDLYCSLLERGHRGEVLPESLFHYRIREDSLAHGMAPTLRHALRAKLVEKHPALVGSMAMRRLLAEEAHLREELSLPRHQLAEKVNETVKRLPFVHRALKTLLRP